MQKLKFSLFLVSTLTAFLLFSCQTASGKNIASADEMLALFERYWDLGEDADTGREFMRQFRQDPAPALDALVLATPFQREQMLALIGSSIANARRNDLAAYAEYAAALDLAAGLDLDEEAARMLTFIHANIAHW